MNRLISIRKELGYTQAHMANALGISRQAYSNYELGNREPDNSTLIALADYFNVSVDYLLGRETEKTEQPTEYGELSAEKKALIDFALAVPEEKAKQVLRVLKAIVEGDE